MTLGDSPCTLLVSPWLREVMGASLVIGQALVQPLLAPGAIVTVIRCFVGGPSECRDASAIVVRRWLSVPISRDCELGLTRRLDSYSDGVALALYHLKPLVNSSSRSREIGTARRGY